jgi:hypothetical protein
MFLSRKSFWGIVFILIIFISVLSIFYQISQAPFRAFGFVSDTALDVYNLDLNFRNSLKNFEETEKGQQINYDIVKELDKEVNKNFELISKINVKIKSLSQVEQWALENYPSTLQIFVNNSEKIHGKLKQQIYFVDKNYQVYNDFNSTIGFLNGSVSELKTYDCKILNEQTKSYKKFLTNLEEDVKNSIVDLNYQKDIYDFINKWDIVTNEIQSNFIEVENLTDNFQTCNFNDKNIQNIIKKTLELNNLPKYNYYPTQKIYITNNYQDNLTRLFDKIETLIDKLA